MNPRVTVFLAALTVAWPTLARNLQADLAAMAPAGQTLRLAYQKGGPPNEDNGLGMFHTADVNTAIYAVSSSDGIKRKLHPGGDSTGDYHCVNITADGSRVVFYDGGRSQIVIVKYDGTFVARFDAPYLYDYWLNPADNTEWAVVSDDNTVYRVNINAANPSATAVTLVSNANLTKILSGCCCMSNGLAGAVSDDGKKILICHLVSSTGMAYPALVDISTASTGSNPSYVLGIPGCWYMMRTGTPIQFSQNAGLNLNAVDRHRGPTIFDTTGTVVQLVHVSDTLDSWISKNPGMDASSCSAYPEDGHAVDGLRWLRNRNYFSVIAERCKVGPILWRMTDNKWTYIEDSISCVYAGDMDGITGTFTPSGVVRQPQSRPAILARQVRESRAYSLDGRLLAGPAKHDRQRPGIVISQSSKGTVTRVYR